MTTPLRLLIAEDNPADAELLLRELRKAGFEPEWTRVDTEEDYLAQLHGDLDIVLSDYVMPQFGGLRALELLESERLRRAVHRHLRHDRRGDSGAGDAGGRRGLSAEGSPRAARLGGDAGHLRKPAAPRTQGRRAGFSRERKSLPRHLRAIGSGHVPRLDGRCFPAHEQPLLRDRRLLGGGITRARLHRHHARRRPRA